MQPNRIVLSLLLFTSVSLGSAQQLAPRLIADPNAFKTLVNPMCSHCKDEAKRRANDLKPNDRVLCWIRGYSDGGVIPYRFFLNPYRVISDTYGVFVYDPDAGYARGFAPSLDFTFHGWKNGVMVMKHKDGTLYSCLAGVAFDGPKKGDKLKAVPTLVSDWGHWLDTYPQAVAYNMFEKYQPVELPTKPHANSLASRSPADKRMSAGTRVFGVAAGQEARAFPIALLAERGIIEESIDGKICVVFWNDETKTAAAYRPVASPPKKGKGEPRPLTLERHPTKRSGYRDKETGSRWDIAGRAVDGELKGWTLEWLDGVEVQWFAWAAEYPHTTIHLQKKEGAEKPNAKDAIKEIAGSAEFLRAAPKKFGKLQSVDVAKHTVTLTLDGDKDATTWPLTPDAEVKIHGWWGRPHDLFPVRPRADFGQVEPRVWAWFKVDRAKKPVSIFMIADDLSEQDIHGDGLTVQSITDKKITFRFAKDKSRAIDRDECIYTRDNKHHRLEDIKPADQLFLRRYLVKTSATPNRYQTHLMDRADFERFRDAQKNVLRQRWLADGLPGAVGFLHVYAGEVDVILDHEAMRWGRSLAPGAKVELVAKPPINAVVKSVTAQREKTQVRLVAKSFDLADLNMGQRVRLKMPAPSAEIENAVMLPGIDLPRAKEDRIEWFLANTYCTCKIGGDGCTGHFYTLASCNPNACGAPNLMRRYVGKKIDDGWTNREIFEALLKEKGQPLLRPHLLP
ncbi:MAG: DUF3179 domain-containing protein [Planctomycetes bacterium]|nr:DUF3179 domain-containing protein [Planctomycetota bacterium]